MKEAISGVLGKFWKFVWKITYSVMSWAFPGSEVDVPTEEDE